MRVASIEFTGFRNLADGKFEPPAGFVVIAGQNAQGKTNFLEAVYLVATAKSFRTKRLKETVRQGLESAAVAALCRSRDTSETEVEITLNGSRRRLFVDGEAVRAASAYIGRVPVVAFVPDHVNLFRGSSSDRRDYLDRLACLLFPPAADAAREFSKVLDQRNSLLKEYAVHGSSLATLPEWDELFVRGAAQVVDYRLQALERIRGAAVDIHSRLAPDDPPLGISYQLTNAGKDKETVGTDVSLSDLEVRMREALEASNSEERRRGHTVVGPQRDEMAAVLGGSELKITGSQGQNRTAVLSLKLAEIEAVLEIRGNAPVVLLDDISSELDREREHHLLDYLAGINAQVFITTTRPDGINLPAGAEPALWHMNAGELSTD